MKKWWHFSLIFLKTNFKLYFVIQSLVLYLIFVAQAHAQWSEMRDISSNNVEAQGISIFNESVRSNSVALDDSHTSRFMLVAVSNLGIFRSLDGGNSFTEAQIQNTSNPGFYLTQYIDQVYVAKQQGLTRRVYAIVNANDYELGTASTSGLYTATLSTPEQEILWEKIGSLQLPIDRLVVDPNDANKLYIIASGSRLLMSIDSGLSFSDSGSGLPVDLQTVISDLVIDPIKPSTLYLLVFQSTANGLYTSTNSGKSWNIVNHSATFHRLAIGNWNGSKHLFSIQIEKLFADAQPQYFVYKSLNEGLTWDKLEISAQNGLWEVASFESDGLTPVAINAKNTKLKSKTQISNTAIFPAATNGSADISLVVNPPNATITAGRSLTFNLTASNQSEMLLTNVTITSDGFPDGITTVFLSEGCVLDSAVVRCSIDSLNVNETEVLSLSLITSSTLPNTLLPLSFALNADELDMPIVAMVSSSNLDGSLTALPGAATVTVGDKLSTGLFVARNANENTEFVLSSGLPANGTFLWNSQNCSDQLFCSDGNFSYIPNGNSGGQTEILQFYVRDSVTFSTSSTENFVITITGRDDTGATVGLWTLFVLSQLLLMSRKRWVIVKS